MPHSILVFSPNWLGDAVMSLPAIEALHSSFPKSEIWVFARRRLLDLFNGVAHVRGTIEAPASERTAEGTAAASAKSLKLGRLTLRMSAAAARLGRSLGTFARKIKELQSRRFSSAVLFPNSFRSALLAFLCGIPERLGYATDGRSSLLTLPVPCTEGTRRLHMAQYYLDVLEPLGVRPAAHSQVPHLTPTREAASKMNHLLKGAPRPFWGVNPGAAYGDAKRWPTDRFARLAGRLVSKSHGTVVVFGSGAERLIAGEIVSAVPTGHAIDLSGETTLAELIAAVADCDVFITNDSGPMHISQAVGTPLVAIFGPTDLSTTGPSGDGHAIVRKESACPRAPCLLRSCPTDHRCMKAISVEDVLEAALKQLRRT